MWVSGRKVLQAKGGISAKALRWNYGCVFKKAGRKPGWLKHSESGEEL